MNKQEINRYIEEKIMGECSCHSKTKLTDKSHEYYGIFGDKTFTCDDCGETLNARWDNSHPDFTEWAQYGRLSDKLKELKKWGDFECWLYDEFGFDGSKWLSLEEWADLELCERVKYISLWWEAESNDPISKAG